MIEVTPFEPSPTRHEVVSKIIRSLAGFETLFTDFERAHTPICENLLECERCATRMAITSRVLSDPRSRSWEIWDLTREKSDLVGLLYVTDVVPGSDALAHYAFFDGKLTPRTPALEGMIQWAFEDHPEEGWIGLRRLTIEIPTYAIMLARHASRKLGFGGPYEYTLSGGGKIPVEGVKRNAIRWNDKDVDVLILGRLRDG